MQVSPTAPILKIAISAGGRITVDGSPATMESLRASLKRLAEQKGVVWYYREAGQAEAPPEWTEVMKAVIENRLPIRLSTRPDFSDAIGADGNPITKRPSRN
jgi:predicted secreted protein